jgi:aspartate-semialdehyde dehydrogenase
MDKTNVAVLGATGTVGQKFLQLLENHPMFDVAEVAASERSAGKHFSEVNWLIPGDMPEKYHGMRLKSASEKMDSDIVFSALPSSAAKELEGKHAKDGKLVISKASANRMEPDIPLIIPEVNPGHIGLVHEQRKRRGYNGAIITDPNCSTIGLSLALKPIYDEFGIDEVIVTTLQALSGSGYPGVPSVDVIDNVVPFIGGEEDKVENEPNKILGTLDNGEIRQAGIKVSASCTRVPVIDGHLESVYIKTKKEADPDAVAEVLSRFKGLPQEMSLPSAPENPVIVTGSEDRPQPRKDRNRGDGMSSVVGRIRPGLDSRSFCFFVLSHNTVRGAAGAGVLDAEMIVSQGELI